MDYAKAFDCVDHNKLWKILQEMGLPDHLMCLFRNLYAGQEATVRTEYESRYGLNKNISKLELYPLMKFESESRSVVSDPL